MKRREFITLVGGMVITWPLAARAQQAMPVIGFLHSGSAEHRRPEVAAFHAGLHEAGFVEGRNLLIEYRWAHGDYDRLTAMAADLARRQVAVIAAIAQPAANAAKAATATIPIVTVIGGDPVKLGLVANLRRPGGNLTGVTFLANVLAAKQLEVLHQVVPRGTPLGILVNKSNPNAQTDLGEVGEAARALDRQLLVQDARTTDGIDAAFVAVVRQQASALVVLADPFLFSRREQLLELAERHALPAIYPTRDFPAAGGLMSYGSGLSDAYRMVAEYTGQILKGAKPGELPVQQSTKVELVINLRTAKRLGISFPLPLLARADEVIE
jgi:putative tryptophan/tyrosine transport system substrate-binding protein